MMLKKLWTLIKIEASRQIEAKKNKSFHFKIGPVETTTPWQRPCQENFDLWRQSFFKLKGINNYTVWLCGGFLEQQWETWDVDIILTGTPNYPELEDILIKGHQIGFENRLLVDIQHYDPFPVSTYYTKDTKPNRVPVKKLVIFRKIFKNGECITDWSSDPTLVKRGEHLWEVTRLMPNKNQLNKISAGFRYHKRPVKLN